MLTTVQLYSSLIPCALSVLQEFYQYIINVTGVKNESIADVWKVYDTVLCEVRLYRV